MFVFDMAASIHKKAAREFMEKEIKEICRNRRRKEAKSVYNPRLSELGASLGRATAEDSSVF